MITFDKVAKMIVLLIMVLITTLLILVMASIRSGYRAIEEAHRVYDLMEEEINWRKL